LGAAGADGSLTSGNVAPGEHTLELRRQGFIAKRFTRSFKAGESVEVGGADTTLERAGGTLRVNVSPAGARLTIRRSDETQARAAQNTMQLSEGSYIVAAQAQGYSEKSETVKIGAGETRTLEIALVRQQEAAPPPKRAGMADWEGGWERRDAWYVRKGGNFILFKPAPRGTFVYTATMLKQTGVLRKRPLQWVAGYTDPRNYLLFQMEDRHLVKKEVVNGRTREVAKIPHGVPERENIYQFQIDIGPDSIAHRVRRGGAWALLDTWKDPRAASGKFGFLVQGNDELGLADFSFDSK
jgi:hypothetical protein